MMSRILLVDDDPTVRSVVGRTRDGAATGLGPGGRVVVLPAAA